MPTDTIKLLFVCSGNTCRSPMAAAITAHFVARRGDRLPRIEVDSVGTGAMGGLPATPEAVRAVSRFDVSLDGHRSKAISHESIAWADVIYCMTPAHVAAVVALDPGAAVRTELIDPKGNSVDDPIGGPQRAYDEAARKLADLIAARLKELDR